MRTKVVLSASVLAVLVLAPALYFRFAPSSPSPDQSAPAPEQAAAAPAVAAPVAAHPRRVVAPANDGAGVTVPDTADSTSDNPEDAVAERVAQLTQLGMSDDPADLKIILTELNNKNSEIRTSALAAVVQFGSKDAIPALKNEMSWTEDPEEKVEIKKAIDYLNLPSFEEFTANLGTGVAQPAGDQPSGETGRPRRSAVVRTAEHQPL